MTILCALAGIWPVAGCCFVMCVSPRDESNSSMIVVQIDKDLSANDDKECSYATDHKDSVLTQLLHAS